MMNVAHREQPQEVIVLFLAANPSSQARLAIENELHRIQNQLYIFSTKKIVFFPATAIQPLEVHRLILSYRPQVIHFSGHGSSDAGILMLDETGAEHPVGPEALAALLEALPGEISCVVLNACYTADQAQIIAQCIPYVIGIPGAIADDAAIAFSVGFYDALAASLPIEKAYQLGCATMAMVSHRRGPPRPTGAAPAQGDRSGHRHLTPAPSNSWPVPILITHQEKPASLDEKSTLPELPSLTHSYAEFHALVEEASRNSLSRLHEKLPGSTSSPDSLLISRDETAPDLEPFFRSSKPVMVILGDSGSGKSTYLYQVAKGEIETSVPYLPLLYDSHQIQAADSLLNRLACDFGIPSPSLFDFLRAVVVTLKKEGQRLLLLIDGINEAPIAISANIKVTVEDLASRFGGEIKIIYTCRSVFWETYLQPEGKPSTALYSGGIQQLGGFSLGEAQRAVAAYRGKFHFSGHFDEMSAELQERVRDPLMLRMLAESYAGSPLPDYAPAVAIFAKYEKRLRRKFAGGPVMHCLERMLTIKADSLLRGERTGDSFRLTDLLGDPRYATLAAQSRGPVPPHVVLEDEGVLIAIAEEEVLLRFAYERFYEFLLGRALVQGWERASEPAESAFQLVEQALQGHYSYAQALKSELIRRSILGVGKSGFEGLLAPERLALLLSGPTRTFAKDVLRELIFDSKIDVPALIYNALGETSSSKLLLIGLAPEAPEISGALLDGLFAAKYDLMLRASQLLPRFLRREGVRQRIEQELLQRMDPFSPSSARALIFFLAQVFQTEQRMGRSATSACASLLRQVFAQSKCTRDDFITILASSFTRVVREEGPKFYGVGFTEAELDYPWKAMGPSERERALELNDLISDCTLLREQRFRELALFFGSRIERWDDFRAGQFGGRNDYQLEDRISQWALMKYSTYDFPDFVAILQTFVASGFWLAIDSALCAMDYALNIYHSADQERLKYGFDRMVSWDESYRGLSRYYWALEFEDPFSINSVPFVMVAGIEARFFTPEGLPIRRLRERLLDGGKDTLLALLTARWLWHEFPKKVLASLEVLLMVVDTPASEWLERILSEIYLVHPRLVEDLLWRNRVDPTRAGRIKHEHGLTQSTNIMYDGTELYKFIFSAERASQVAYWHRRIYATEDLADYCSELSRFLVLEAFGDLGA